MNASLDFVASLFCKHKFKNLALSCPATLLRKKLGRNYKSICEKYGWFDNDYHYKSPSGKANYTLGFYPNNWEFCLAVAKQSPKRRNSKYSQEVPINTEEKDFSDTHKNLSFQQFKNGHPNGQVFLKNIKRREITSGREYSLFTNINKEVREHFLADYDFADISFCWMTLAYNFYRENWEELPFIRSLIKKWGLKEIAKYVFWTNNPDEKQIKKIKTSFSAILNGARCSLYEKSSLNEHFSKPEFYRFAENWRAKACVEEIRKMKKNILDKIKDDFKTNGGGWFLWNERSFAHNRLSNTTILERFFEALEKEIMEKLMKANEEITGHLPIRIHDGFYAEQIDKKVIKKVAWENGVYVKVKKSAKNYYHSPVSIRVGKGIEELDENPCFKQGFGVFLFADGFETRDRLIYKMPIFFVDKDDFLFCAGFL